MLAEELLRLVHVIGATVLFGTGAGIAFFMVMAHRTGDPKLIAHVGNVISDHRPTSIGHVIWGADHAASPIRNPTISTTSAMASSLRASAAPTAKPKPGPIIVTP